MFPIKQPVQPKWGFGNPSHSKLEAYIDRFLNEYNQFLLSINKFSKEVAKWSKDIDPKCLEKPHLKNNFISLADAIILYGVLRNFQPKKYLEIGSGISTKIAFQAKRLGNFPMEITSIDPEPRDVIDNICDLVVRKELENVDMSLFSALSDGDVLFFDGSHHCFPGNDVTRFFLDILPCLQVGVIVHIHDIYLPDDYPQEMLKFMWSEQYVLAAWLLGGGQGFNILFPSAYMSKKSEMINIIGNVVREINDDEISNSSWQQQGTSFWIVKS